MKLLAFNDFHGHLEANTPGTIQIGAAFPTRRRAAAGDHGPGGRVREYFATHLKRLGLRTPTRTSSVPATIGATPLLSGLFHDEPTIDFNYAGVDTVGVGNHEFDEGGELPADAVRQPGVRRRRPEHGPRMRPFRSTCHPVDGCQDGTPFYGSAFQYLAANVIDQSTENPLLPAYDIVNTSTGEKIAFIGETLKERR